MPPTNSGASESIRPIDPNKDLRQITDLIELCFAGTLDSDGLDYIRQLRQMITNGDRMFWFRGGKATFSYPVSGFVYLDDSGRIVGNLTIIPIPYQRRWYYLIANVAVHPDQRRKGIARQLTLEAIRFAREHQFDDLWLHVRTNNPAARQLYDQLNFVPQTERTTWIFEPDGQLRAAPENHSIHWSRHTPREAFNTQLALAYPEMIRWNIGLEPENLWPGWLGMLKNFFAGVTVHQRSAAIAGAYAGTYALQKTTSSADSLWIAVDPESDNVAFTHLLADYSSHLRNPKPVQVNFQMGKQEAAFLESGWKVHNQLTWMKLEL